MRSRNEVIPTASSQNPMAMPIAQAIWGADFHRMSSPYPQILSFGDLTLPAQRLMIIVAAFVLVLLLQLFLKKTITGATIVAMAQNRDGAALVGIDANRVAMLTFAVSAFSAVFSERF